MRARIAYKIIKTYSRLVPADTHTQWDGSHEIVAIEGFGRWGSPDQAQKDARKIADMLAKYGILCWQYPELDIIHGDDKLVLSVHPIILMDGIEVETDHIAEPILSLTVSKATNKDRHVLSELRNAYNLVNMRSGQQYTRLY